MAISARIDELRKKFDENPRRYFAPLANEYRKAGDLDQAIFICQEYLPLQPGHMSGHIVYGQALFDMSRNDEAKAVFETALSLDPENLIALRHLGDIARKAGDTNSARIWYQRVLEADPRNEEIAQIMISLLSAPAAPDAPEASDTAPPVAETPRSSRAVGLAGAASGAGLDVEQSPEAPALSLPPELPPPLPDPTPPPPADELLDLEDFSIGGVQVSATAPTVQIEAVPTPEPAESPPPTEESDETGVFHLGREDGPFEADPYAIAAAPEPEPEPAPAEADAREAAATADVDVPHAEAATEPAPTSEPVVDGLETFEAGVIAVPADVVIAASGLETESFFDIDATPLSTAAQPAEPVEPPHAAPSDTGPTEEAAAIHELAADTTAEMRADSDAPARVPATEEFPSAQTPEPEAPAEPEAPVEAFVTETMAELYLQQGHIDSALEIYRRLVELRPNEPPLQARLRALEDYGNATPPEPITEPEAPAPSIEYSGPTIREFLVGLTARTTQEAVEPEPMLESAYEPAYEPGADYAADSYDESVAYSGESFADSAAESFADSSAEPFVDSAAEAPIDDEPEPEPRVSASRPTPRPTPSYAGETVSGSIDALFGGADPSSSDANAATTLAEAFASEPPDAPESDPPPLRGVPAHLASQELSLDHVFKSRTPARPSGDGFSFDQFFAGEAHEAASGTAGEGQSGGAPAEATDDVAQFNAWLNGLKKT